MPHAIDDELRLQLDRLACATVLGQVIDTDNAKENYQFDETYPLRFHLRQLSRYIWYDLLKDGKREQDVMHAVIVVRREFAAYLPAPVASYIPIDVLHVQRPSERILDDHWDARREMRQLAESEAEARVPQIGKWCIETDTTIGLELVEDNWLQNKELWGVEQDWTWAHVYDFLALVTIAAAVSNLEEGLPFKSAVNAARASEYHGMATAVRWAQTAESFAVSSLGKRGSDVRHSSNRAAKDEAIQLFLAKTWPSQAQAARVIGNKVNKTERVVEKWLREYKRSSSSGTETS